jgi:antitoxin component YwqK of YwqJK toxin-antitoxin module
MAKYQVKGDKLIIFEEEIGIDIEDAKPDKKSIQKYSNGTIQLEQCTLKGALHGPVIAYSKVGKPIAESWFSRGRRQGKTILYYRSGALYAIERYRDDAKDGKQEYYYENGSPKTEVLFERGKQIGKAKLWSPQGEILAR